MATRMLIDARHGEETRVAVLKGNRIEEFDFESSEHEQIKGNIYLAKVTRVEPSLQAAFVDFGGNRHGFLAFSEIHPDYYQIPKEDREALLEEEALAAEEEARLRAEEDEEEDARQESRGGYDQSGDNSEGYMSGDYSDSGVEEIDTSEKDDVATIEEGHLDDDSDEDEAGDDDSQDDAEDNEESQDERGGQERGRSGRGRKGRRQGRSQGRDQGRGNGKKSAIAKEVDEVRARRQALRRRYKIQDVIQRRQVLLVQVVKEERGNKGAALTTYLSLAGRYTVLMPNSSHGGGISRKISSSQDRKRLKQMVSDLTLPKSMGLIIRTAGLTRNKPEIRRDFDYLARLWDEIREKTLASAAPALIHSDSDLIKRAIRDLYNRDIEEVVVEGAEGYKAAKEFMKLLMPSHARKVKAYSDPVPLFQRFGAEDQLRAMYDPVVQLKSGGYLVINPTEALVSIDINSGRSTKEHGIEATATATNLEAAKEIARQLRLRDMAGLVVIDFIDMEYSSNIRKVERAMKDALKNDRARIQVGRISSFGLMEMSRQRLRTGVLEATTRECPHCDGSGLVRTASSAGLSALRLIEDEAAKGKGSIITLRASTEAAIYLLNTKRADLSEIEELYHVSVEVVPDGENEGAKMSVSSSGPRPSQAPRFEPIVIEEEDFDDIEDDEDDEDDGDNRGEGRAENSRSSRGEDGSDDDRPRKKRRRRGGRGRKNRREEGSEEGGSDAVEGSDDTSEDASDDRDAGTEEREGGREGGRGKSRSRRRRGGKASAADTPTTGDAAANEAPVEAEAEAEAKEKPKRRTRASKPKADSDTAAADSTPSAEPAEEKPAATKRAPRKKAEPKADKAAAKPAKAAKAKAEASEPAEAAAEKPKRKPRAAAKKVSDEPATASDAPKAEKAAPKKATSTKAEAKSETTKPESEGAETGEPRRGWWQRTFGE